MHIDNPIKKADKSNPAVWILEKTKNITDAVNSNAVMLYKKYLKVVGIINYNVKIKFASSLLTWLTSSSFNIKSAAFTLSAI
jgi:hypothetical protein